MQSDGNVKNIFVSLINRGLLLKECICYFPLRVGPFFRGDPFRTLQTGSYICCHSYKMTENMAAVYIPFNVCCPVLSDSSHLLLNLMNKLKRMGIL